MDEQISSMDGSVINGCHPWMEEPHPWMKVSLMDGGTLPMDESVIGE